MRQQLGSALAEKASDEFCLAVAPPGRTWMLMERITAAPTGAPHAVSSVLEFGPRAVRPGAPESVPDAAAATVRETMEKRAEAVPAAEKSLVLLLRQAAVKDARDDFYRSIGRLRDEIERSTAALVLRRRRAPRIGIAAAPVQACWLNRTIRAESDPRVLGDLAAEPSVERVDLPRPLAPDQLAVDVTIEEARLVQSQQKVTGRSVTVGVIDSEVALGHPGLQDRVIHRRNYTQESFGTPDAHGTAVAGIIAARSDAFSGMAPDALIYNYKVLATHAALHAEDFEGALAIQHALEDGVRVVNCSWGAGPASDGMSREARACNTAWGLGLTVVKSAGNRGPGASTLTTPAEADGIITVGATDSRGGSIPDYSSRGPTADGRHRPHLVAPGGDVGDEMTSALVGGAFGAVGFGTSFAAPHVSGLVALILERHPDLTPAEQRDRLLTACTALPGLAEDDQGAGIVSAARVFP